MGKEAGWENGGIRGRWEAFGIRHKNRTRGAEGGHSPSGRESLATVIGKEGAAQRHRQSAGPYLRYGEMRQEGWKGFRGRWGALG
jgi:hypothetical protein